MKIKGQAMWAKLPAGSPPALKQGDTVGVVAPAGIVDREKLGAGIRMLQSRGFDVLVGPHVYGQRYLFSGTDDERTVDLLAMLRDPKIKAVFCARGGYGSQRLLNNIVPVLHGLPRKIFVGYSDITALHTVLGQAGWVTFHGPMPCEWRILADGGQSVTSLFSLIMGRTTDWLPLPTDARLEPWREGNATGPLVGGNLSLLAALLGTPYSVETRGAILFLEDVGEAPYRLDRMLSSLSLAGKFADVKGVLLGDFTNCDPPAGGPSVTADDVLAGHFRNLDVPVIKGYPGGHGKFNFALPFGATVQLDTARPGVRLVSQAVI